MSLALYGLVRWHNAAIPLRNGLFTPKLQWQSRGKMAYLTGAGGSSGIEVGKLSARRYRVVNHDGVYEGTVPPLQHWLFTPE
jgi:hypothetical protein